MNNIITTIESKLELMNTTKSTMYEYNFEYAILELDKTNLDSVDTIINRVKSLI